jgi:hypothetical protein
LTFRFKFFFFFFFWFFFSVFAGANDCAAGMCANLLVALSRTDGAMPNSAALAGAAAPASDEKQKKKKKIEVVSRCLVVAWRQ